MQNSVQGHSCASPKFRPAVKSTACEISSRRPPALTLVHAPLVLAVVWITRSRFSFTRSLLLENLALRQQLTVLKRKHPKPKLRVLDKLFWVLARRCWSAWKESLIVVTPETVVKSPPKSFQPSSP